MAHFTSCPAHELFNLQVPLDALFDKQKVRDTQERLACANTAQQRIQTIERFLLAECKAVQPDKLIMEAVKLIHQSKGQIQMKALNQQLMISPSPFEKRFRKLLGTTPKKFASLVRFNSVLDQLNGPKSLIDICFEHNFFDQAHFSRAVKTYTGESPEKFIRFQ